MSQHTPNPTAPLMAALVARVDKAHAERDAKRAARRTRVNHVLHAILTVLTGGLWGIVWLVLALRAADARRAPQPEPDAAVINGRRIPHDHIAFSRDETIYDPSRD